MSDLVFIDNGSPVTSSELIADNAEVQHKNLIELIRRYESDLREFGIVAFQTRKPTGPGRPSEYALLNEQQCTLIFSYLKNTAVVRAFKMRLVKEFYRLAQAQRQEPDHSFHVPQTLSGALRLAAEQADRIEDQQRQLEANRPAVEFARQVTRAPDSISIGEAAKIIGTGRGRLFAFLRQLEWINRRNEPYQLRIAGGLMDVKLGRFEHPEQGLKSSVTPLITGKGLAKLQIAWMKHHHGTEQQPTGDSAA